MADEEQSGGESPAEQQGEPAERGPGEQSEEELRAQLEDQIRNLKVEDVILQSAVSILNLAARRTAKEDERDLEQARVGIEAARALTELVPEDARPQLRQAVSEMELLYAKHAGGDAKHADGDDG
jgi:hypothetical protein